MAARVKPAFESAVQRCGPMSVASRRIAQFPRAEFGVRMDSVPGLINRRIHAGSGLRPVTVKTLDRVVPSMCHICSRCRVTSSLRYRTWMQLHGIWVDAMSLNCHIENFVSNRVIEDDKDCFRFGLIAKRCHKRRPLGNVFRRLSGPATNEDLFASVLLVDSGW